MRAALSASLVATFLVACASDVPPAAAPCPAVAPSASPAASGAPVASPASPALAVDPANVRASALSARIRFLSDDLLEGRSPGTSGHAIAERYVASELQSMGAEPAGDGGTYLQAVPMRSALKDPAKSSLSVRSRGKPDLTLKLDEDYIFGSDLQTPKVDVEAPLVFAGFGVTAPEYKYDDLAGLDVKGKIVVVLSTAPLSDKDDFFPPIAHAIYSDSREKAAHLAALGAVGMISVFRPEDEERLPWARVTKQSHIEQMTWLTKDGKPGTTPPGMSVRGTLYWKAFDALLARNGLGTTASLEDAAKKRSLKGFDLQASAHEKLATGLRDFTAHNVVGVLRGSDPKLSAESVVYSAHIDHLGVGAAIDGDRIYNGAMDNASGVAAILEIARAYAAAPKHPARSVVFIAVTGEERGLLGSDYFARYPTAAAGTIVADFNDDMVLGLAPLHDVVALGVDDSSLGPLTRAAAASLGLAMAPDPEPTQLHFIRSDQYSFIHEGIPAIVVGPGLKDEQGHTEANLAKRHQWIATRYHSPADQWDPSYDYEAMAQVARVELLAGFAAANSPERPAWAPGDFLGTRFAKK
jgi:hypothetical protein